MRNDWGLWKATEKKTTHVYTRPSIYIYGIAAECIRKLYILLIWRKTDWDKCLYHYYFMRLSLNYCHVVVVVLGAVVSITCSHTSKHTSLYIDKRCLNQFAFHWTFFLICKLPPLSLSPVLQTLWIEPFFICVHYSIAQDGWYAPNNRNEKEKLFICVR